MKQINLSYNVPIEVSESLDNTEEFTIQGVAISSSITDNRHKFLSEELQLASQTLMGRPLLKDHDNSVDSVIGRVVLANFDNTSDSIMFKARINKTEQGNKIRELIKSGDLNTVSIGANVTAMDEEDGLLVPRGIKFKELSVVAVPADDNATFTFRGSNFTSALEEAYNSTIKEQMMKCPECDKMVNKEEMKKHMDSKHPNKMKDSNSPSLEDNKIIKKEDIMEKDEANVKSESTVDFEEKFNAQAEKLEAQGKILAELLSNVKTLSEALNEVNSVKEAIEEMKNVKESEAVVVEDEKEEEPKEVEPAKEETEDEDEDLDVDAKNNYKIVQNYKSFTVERKYR